MNRVASHGPFLIVSTSKHYGLGRGDCLRCHPALRSDKAFGADFGVPDCLGCHDRAGTDAHHAGESEYVWATAACLRCHPTGVRGGD